MTAMFLRSFAILCAVSALIALLFWVGDAITHRSFTLGWLLAGSVFWMLVSWVAYRYFKPKQ